MLATRSRGYFPSYRHYACRLRMACCATQPGSRCRAEDTRSCCPQTLYCYPCGCERHGRVEQTTLVAIEGGHEVETTALVRQSFRSDKVLTCTVLPFSAFIHIFPIFDQASLPPDVSSFTVLRREYARGVRSSAITIPDLRKFLRAWMTESRSLRDTDLTIIPLGVSFCYSLPRW